MSDVAVVASTELLPDTPAGRQARWYVLHLTSAGVDLSVEDVAGHMALPAPWTPREGLQRFLGGARRVLRIDTVAARSALEIDITFEDGTGKPRQLSITVEDRKPHRIVKLWWARALASDIVVRSAAAGDSSALRELELRAPMILGPTMKLVYDRGADFLAFDRMMENSACFVAERDGSVLGVACGARHTIRVGGQTHAVMLLHHARVAAEHRDLGLVSVLINHVFSAFDEPFECAYGYRAVDNADAERIRAPGRWDAGVCRAVIDCAAVAGPAHGRPATPADAAAVVDILDRAHAGEQMYFSPTPASFAARLERAPDL